MRVFEKEEQRTSPLLSVFYTAGFPEHCSTVEIARHLEEASVDFIEIGIPYSDPLADGPVIQRSSMRALENGMCVSRVIEQVREIRKECDLPIFLMGYYNPVLQFGVERFLDEIADAGADGVILPDLPLSVYSAQYEALFRERELSNVFLITPHTSEKRIRAFDEASSSFLYVVSSPSITGAITDAKEERDRYLARIEALSLRSPLIVGFGISDRESFTAVTRYADGAIVGTAFLRQLEEHGVEKEAIHRFVAEIREGDPR
ncbi:tryptophan synthase subunit alpha [bacterium]|nr:tryptophan synthase subunit alpha [bacterium]